MMRQVELAIEDDTAIRGLLAGMAETWARGDGPGYGAVFTEDARYVTAPGNRLIGRQAIADGHTRIFRTIFKDTRLGRNYPLDLQPVAPGVVLVHGCGSVLFRGEDERRVPPNGLVTMVAVHQDDDGWRFAAFSNTPTGKARGARFLGRFLKSRLAR